MKLLQQSRLQAPLALCVIPLLVVGAVAFAQDTNPASGNRTFSNQFYGAVGAGLTRLDPDADDSSIDVGDLSSAGFSVAVGYDFTSWLSVELYYADLGSASIDFLDQDVGDVDYQVYGVDAIATVYRFGNRERQGLSLYARAGLGGLENDSNLDFRRDHATHVSFGAGAEYGFQNGLALRAELNSFDTDAQLLQVSLVKRFGGSPNQRATLSPIPNPVPAATTTPIEAPAPIAQTPAPTSWPTAYFGFDVDTLSAEASETVKDIASVLSDVEGQIIIEGHADETGPIGYNQALSTRRANAVRDQLVAEGIDASRTVVRGFGETRPAVSNATAEGRAQNRRVEVILRAL